MPPQVRNLEFTLDWCFTETATQEDVYNTTSRQQVNQRIAASLFKLPLCYRSRLLWRSCYRALALSYCRALLVALALVLPLHLHRFLPPTPAPSL
eukprot:6173633-Pleurochrysis_carterae.AAC.1